MPQTGATPATNWKENIKPDEEERFQRYADVIVSIQKDRSQKYGNGRGLHREQLLGLEASLEVKADLPEPARQGIFASPKTYDCLVRLSNGSLDINSDGDPDIRGFAFKVLRVSGKSALGNGNASSQDFLLINHESFSSPGVDPFIALVQAAAKSKISALGYLIRTKGFFGALGQLKTLSKKFTGFATEPFNTVVPHACGPYAVRVRLQPMANAINPGAKKDWGKDIQDRLEKGPLVYEVQLQFFISEDITPIEDASVVWPADKSPFVTVATLTIPQQSFGDEKQQAREKRIEGTIFDPWNGLLEHRPLGEIMRARKFAYYASQQTRSAKPE